MPSGQKIGKSQSKELTLDFLEKPMPVIWHRFFCVRAGSKQIAQANRPEMLGIEARRVETGGLFDPAPCEARKHDPGRWGRPGTSQSLDKSMRQ